MTDLLPQQPQPDPRGWLCFTEPLPEPWQSAEDATQHHDSYGTEFRFQSGYDEAADAWVDYFERPATDTEKTLLGLLGYAVPADLTTRVSFPSPLVRRRRWPALETPAPQEESA